MNFVVVWYFQHQMNDWRKVKEIWESKGDVGNHSTLVHPDSSVKNRGKLSESDVKYIENALKNSSVLADVNQYIANLCRSQRLFLM